jgi:SOS-response transcriptional repressor LexA
MTALRCPNCGFGLARPGLTPAMKRMLDAIVRLTAANGHPPSYDELLVETGLRSKSLITRAVSRLEKRGYVTHRPGCSRSIAVIGAPR